MSKYVIEDTTLSSIADAVREKTGGTELIKVSELPSAIAAIESGGGADLSSIQLERSIRTYTFSSGSSNNTSEISLSDLGISDDLSDLAVIIADVYAYDYNSSSKAWEYTLRQGLTLYRGASGVVSTKGLYSTSTSNNQNPILEINNTILCAPMFNYNGSHVVTYFYKVNVFRYKEV